MSFRIAEGGGGSESSLTFGTPYYTVNMERVLFPGESSDASSVTVYNIHSHPPLVYTSKWCMPLQALPVLNAYIK